MRVHLAVFALVLASTCLAGHEHEHEHEVQVPPRLHFTYPLDLDPASGLLTYRAYNDGVAAPEVHLVTLQLVRRKIFAKPDVDLTMVALTPDDYIEPELLSIDDALKIPADLEAAGVGRHVTVMPGAFLAVRMPVWSLDIWPRILERDVTEASLLLKTYGSVWVSNPDRERRPWSGPLEGSGNIDSPGTSISPALFRKLKRLQEVSTTAKPPAIPPAPVETSAAILPDRGLIRVSLWCTGPEPIVIDRGFFAWAKHGVVMHMAKAEAAGLPAQALVPPTAGLLLVPGEGLGIDFAIADLAIWPAIEEAVRAKAALSVSLPAIYCRDQDGTWKLRELGAAAAKSEALDATVVREMRLRQRERDQGLVHD